MDKELFNSLTAVALAIVGLAVIATLVSKSANTANILGAGGSALGNAITAAEAPVSGNGLGVLSGAGFQNFG